jgi:hypothetical protein
MAWKDCTPRQAIGKISLPWANPAMGIKNAMTWIGFRGRTSPRGRLVRVGAPAQGRI